MSRDFDIFVKQHVDDILCQVEKEHTLAQLKKNQKKMHWHTDHKQHHSITVPQIYLQDCAISPSFLQAHP